MKVVVRLVVLTAVMAWSVLAVGPAAAQTYPTYPPATPAQPAPVLGQHTVAAGDTLDCIGRAYQVDPAAIAQANGTSTLTVGQKLNIPGVAWLNIPPLPAGMTCTTQQQFNIQAIIPGWPILGKHTVQQGEWIYSIARTYRVNPIAIAQASGIPGPYTPVCGGCGWYAHPTPYGGCGTCGGYYGGCGYSGGCGYYGGCGGYYGGCCGGPWNFVYPGQVLTIPGVWWFSVPPGPTVMAQFALPSVWK